MAIHIGLLLQVVKPLSLAGVLFACVVASPCLLISEMAVLLHKRGAWYGCALGLSLAYLVFGAWAYYDAMYVHPDPQNALIFIVVPVFGILATVIGTVVVFAISRRASAGSDREART